MRILQLCKKFPYPLKDGESIAVMVLSQSLHQLGCEVSLLAMNTTKHYFDAAVLPSEMSHYKAVYTVDIDNRVKPWAAAYNLLANKSYHISRFESAAFRKRLLEVLSTQEFDIVQLETVYLAPYVDIIRAHSDARIALRAHNVEHEIWHRIADNIQFKPKKWYVRHLANQLERYETESLRYYDMLVAITQRDLKKMQAQGFKNAAAVVPIGLPVGKYQPDYHCYEQALSLSFIGSLDWMPNQEGLKWFLNEVWNNVQLAFPELKLHIAGRNTPAWLFQLKAPNVFVHGEVPDAAEFINQHSVMIVPLLSGSGMRAKILEAMALGKVVVSTSVGLEGIGAEDRKEVLFANTPEEFLASLSYCIDKGKSLEQMGRNAFHFVEKNYDNLAVGQKLIKAYTDLTVEAI
jgi:glycosyltransferase involved in cell wall biosynthesis